MAMARKFADLERMSRDELVALHDENTPNGVLGLDFIRGEIFRRDTDEANQTMLALTRKIAWLTVVVTVMTVANVAIVIVALFIR